MRLLITGAGGLVGRSLLADPRADDHVILAPSRAALDLTDAIATRDYLAAARPDLVIHLAAVVGGIQANIDAPARFLGENLAIGLNVLNAAQAAGAPRLINLASSCMYPRDLGRPLVETDLLTGALESTNEGYALAKIAAWKLVQAMAAEDSRLVWRTLIPTNLYGPFDHFDPVRSHLVAAALLKIEAAIAEGRDTVEIWGDGLARREFLFAGDLADFIWTFHDRLESLPDTLNLGVGEDATVNDYYAAAARALGWAGEFRHDLARPVGMTRKLLDVSAQTRLGWRPRTNLDQGLARTVAWRRQATAGVR